MKFQLKSINENFKQIREKQEQDMKKSEQKFITAENNYELEKNRLTQQLGQYKILMDTLNKYKNGSQEEKELIINKLFKEFSNIDRNTLVQESQNKNGNRPKFNIKTNS